VEIHVVQGERPMAADNKSLGKFILDGIPPAPRGIPQIEVTFDIDANGILNVSARDKATGREQKITITASSGLAEAEIDRMVKEAEKFRAEDERRKESAEARNQAESAIFAAEKLLRDFADRLPEDAKRQTQERIDAVREAVNGGDTERIKSSTEALSQHIQTLGGRMYEQAGPQGPGEASSGDGANGQQQRRPDEDVVDADFTEA
jgi:molecular chaperone DnaK